MSGYDDFMTGLEQAILEGFIEEEGEEVLHIGLSAEKVVEYLEELGVIKFINEN